MAENYETAEIQPLVDYQLGIHSTTFIFSIFIFCWQLLERLQNT